MYNIYELELHPPIVPFTRLTMLKVLNRLDLYVLVSILKNGITIFIAL